MHVFGTGDCPPHKCKNIHEGLELYTEKRFVALTGDRIQGNAAKDCTEALEALVREFFPKESGDAPVVWTSQPVAGWDGITDDDELIEKARKSQSTANVFGDGVSFDDLWTANVGPLS